MCSYRKVRDDLGALITSNLWYACASDAVVWWEMFKWHHLDEKNIYTGQSLKLSINVNNIYSFWLQEASKSSLLTEIWIKCPYKMSRVGINEILTDDRDQILTSWWLLKEIPNSAQQRKQIKVFYGRFVAIKIFSQFLRYIFTLCARCVFKSSLKT